MENQKQLYNVIFLCYNIVIRQSWEGFFVKNVLSDRLNYLTILAEEKNMTKAAARLFISQPALTAYLNRLEEELGAKLFDRSTSPIKLTDAGAYYLSELEKLCNTQDRIHLDLAHFSGDTETKLNLGIGRNRGSIWLPQMLPMLYRRYPDVQLSISEDRDTNMIERVINGALDVALVESYSYHSNLGYLRLPGEDHVIVAAASLPLAAGVDLSQNSPKHPLDIPVNLLDDQIFICPRVRGGVTRSTQWLCATYNFHPKRMLFVSNDITAYRLTVNGVGITFQNSAYAQYIQTKEKPLFIMPGGKPAIRHLYAVFNRERLTRLQKDFLRIMHDVMCEYAYGFTTPMEYM